MRYVLFLVLVSGCTFSVAPGQGALELDGEPYSSVEGGWTVGAAGMEGPGAGDAGPGSEQTAPEANEVPPVVTPTPPVTTPPAPIPVTPTPAPVPVPVPDPVPDPVVMAPIGAVPSGMTCKDSGGGVGKAYQGNAFVKTRACALTELVGCEDYTEGGLWWRQQCQSDRGVFDCYILCYQ